MQHKPNDRVMRIVNCLHHNNLALAKIKQQELEEEKLNVKNGRNKRQH